MMRRKLKLLAGKLLHGKARRGTGKPKQFVRKTMSEWHERCSSIGEHAA
nr:MAG TPA: hypothetical protein [Caudoviricetes sp.]